MPDDRKPLGDRCEELAARYLEREGLIVLARKHRTRLGEIDLICEDGRTVVFVEVKARRSARFGSAAEAVGTIKQRRLMAIAELVMARMPQRPCRFDVVAITLRGEQVTIEHLPDAFP